VAADRPGAARGPPRARDKASRDRPFESDRQALAHRGQLAARVDHVDAARIRPRALEIRRAHAAEEILLLALELVGGTGALALAQRRIARVEIEEERRIGLQAGMHEPLEGGDRLAVEAAAAALIGVRGIA